MTSPASSIAFRLASRLDDIGFSDIVNIRNRIMKLRAEGAKVHQFEGGEPYMNTPDFVKQGMTQALEQNKTRYAPSSGIPELRSAIADKLRVKNNIPAADTDVIVLNGGMQGLFGAFQSVVNPGDEVLVFSPFWTPIKDLIVFADEAYEDLVYDGEHCSIASIEGMFERTITSFTLSKSYAMTGWRLGYAVAPEPWMTGLRKTTLYSSNGVSTPTQWAALAAFTTESDMLESNRVAYRERRDLMLAGLNEIGLVCEKPAGAFYAFPDVTRISSNSREAAEILLERAQVATVPGVVFGAHGEGHLRFSFSTSIESIEAGIDSLRRNL